MLSATEVLLKNYGWHTVRQMEQSRQTGDWRKNRWRDRMCIAGDRKTGKRGSPDRHALLVAGQAVGIGRRHGDSK